MSDSHLRRRDPAIRRLITASVVVDVAELLIARAHRLRLRGSQHRADPRAHRLLILVFPLLVFVSLSATSQPPSPSPVADSNSNSNSLSSPSPGSRTSFPISNSPVHDLTNRCSIVTEGRLLMK
ncbi:unnamed protein product [Linum tenue]|uniref:Uncharacterized protein n=1 Tax=Linum tenue TaxID=586396 RepID=A0AAV0NUV4_9ROSI|nr:unnamed protein product [Linum tenue]